MTFSEYFNALYPYLSDGDKPVEFFDSMVCYFIYDEAQEACNLLSCKPDTKKRYIRKTTPNKIKPEYAQYAYSQHNPNRYIEWLEDRMYKLDTYDKIEEWLTDHEIEYKDCSVACDALLENIFFSIAYPNNSAGSAFRIPEKTQVEISDSQQLSEGDMTLLKDFCVDFDSILEKCITNDQSEVWFTSKLSKRVDALYNEKWKEIIPRFDSITLQAVILSTIATLQDFCKTMNPDNEFPSDYPIRKLRMKLKDNYMKIHPDSYAGMFPYDAIIDDWNDELDFEM